MDTKAHCNFLKLDSKLARPISLQLSSLSEEAFVLSTAWVAKLAQHGRPRFQGIMHNQVPVEACLRKFHLVEIRGHLYWADAATGSLYDQAGRCMSSNNQSLRKAPMLADRASDEVYSLPLAA